MIDQWNEDLDDFGFDEEFIVANSSNPSWKRELNNYLLDINTDISEQINYVTTQDTFLQTIY